MSQGNSPSVGDVISSAKFACGYCRDENKEFVIVDGKTHEYLVTYRPNLNERLAETARSGKIAPEARVVDLGAYDPSRGVAKFVVEEARMEGGGTGHGPGDIYPDGWHVKARRLNDDGSYDQNGEVIQFYTSGCFTCMVEPEDIDIVGKMRMQFV